MKKQNCLVFVTAQQIGKSLFLPTTVLPFAGMLSGIDRTFSNPITIETYYLDHVFHFGSLLLNFMILISNVDSIIFENLPLILVLAVALSMTKKEKEIAIFRSAIFYIIAHNNSRLSGV